MKFTLTLFLVFFLTRRGQSTLPGSCSATDGVCETSNAPNSDICIGDACACNVHYEVDGSDPTACAKIDCSSTPCTANGYCDTTATPDECKCKSNFVDTSNRACDRRTCSGSDKTCFNEEAHSYCDTVPATDECKCGFLAPADPTTGACTQSTCTKNDDCGQNNHGALCISGQCHCPANKIPGASACIDRTCAIDTDCTTNGDSNSVCDTAKCACKTDWVEVDESCKKECSSDSVCHSTNGYCNTHCFCDVNYMGDGVTCTQKSCSADSDCTAVPGDPNSACSGGSCACKTGWTSNNESCKKTCTNATSDCHEDAHCNTYCICNINYEGDGVATCTQKGCTSTAECGHVDLVCDTTNSKCECKSGFETSGATCVESTTTAETTTGNGSTAVSLSVQLIFFMLGCYRVAKMFE